jgi:hypothetical protein
MALMSVYVIIYIFRFQCGPCRFKETYAITFLLYNKAASQKHTYGPTLWLANLMLDYWLEVSLHPEGPATDQLV